MRLRPGALTLDELLNLHRADDGIELDAAAWPVVQRSAAVVPRRKATLTGTGLKNSHSSPASSITSTKSGGVHGLWRAPCWR